MGLDRRGDCRMSGRTPFSWPRRFVARHGRCRKTETVSCVRKGGIGNWSREEIDDGESCGQGLFRGRLGLDGLQLSAGGLCRAFRAGIVSGGILKNGFRALSKTAGFVRKTGGEAFLRRGAAVSRSGGGEKDRFCLRSDGRASGICGNEVRAAGRRSDGNLRRTARKEDAASGP